MPSILTTIGELTRAGYSAAEIAAKLEAEHGIAASAHWVTQVRGADGFAHVAALPVQAGTEV